MSQATLAEYGVTNTPDAGGGPLEWGPTAREPVPIAENQYLPGSDVDRRQLPGTGLAPSDFELIAAKCSPQTARERGYHPDDETRRDRLRKERFNMDP